MTSQNDTSKPKISVAVVGGGIGGLSLAIGLLELPNVDVQVYEAAHTFGEVGLGVNIAPNAQQALAMISPNTAAALEAEGTSNVWKSHAGIFTTVIAGHEGPDDGKLITVQRNATGMRSVHRAKFLDKLVSYIPAERAHFNKRLVSIEQHDTTSKLRVGFQDGTKEEFDCVIGADGIHSQVRKIMIGENHPMAKPKWTGTACFRALIPKERAIEKLGEEYAQNCYLMCGPGAAIFSYPVEHGESFNIIMMYFNHPEWTADKWVIPSSIGEVQGCVKGWNQRAQDLVALMSEHDLSKWAMNHHPGTPFYNKGRICIIGDAAHATTPFQGQGAGQAIEDALTLKTLLSNVEDTAQIQHAFHAFDLTRRARAESVVTTSWISGQIQGMSAENIGTDLAKIKEALDVSFLWMWNRDLQDQNREAVKLFHEAFAPSV